MKYISVILFFLACLISQQSLGQQVTERQKDVDITDTTRATRTIIDREDSSSRKVKKLFQPNAKKAGMYSSILPGLGQAYNRQYWKLPLVYAVLGTAGYFIKTNLDNYNKYRQAYIYSIDGDPTTINEFEQYSSSDLQSLQNNYRKNLDLTVLLTALGYSIQILDAVASAHLKNFDISPDISMQMQPVIAPNYIGMGLVMNFK